MVGRGACVVEDGGGRDGDIGEGFEGGDDGCWVESALVEELLGTFCDEEVVAAESSATSQDGLPPFLWVLG